MNVLIQRFHLALSKCCTVALISSPVKKAARVSEVCFCKMWIVTEVNMCLIVPCVNGSSYAFYFFRMFLSAGVY